VYLQSISDSYFLYVFYRVPSDRPLSDGRPVHRPVPSNVIRQPPLPYRLRTIHWKAVFGTVCPPGQTVTISTQRLRLHWFDVGILVVPVAQAQAAKLNGEQYVNTPQSLVQYPWGPEGQVQHSETVGQSQPLDGRVGRCEHAEPQPAGGHQADQCISNRHGRAPCSCRRWRSPTSHIQREGRHSGMSRCSRNRCPCTNLAVEVRVKARSRTALNLGGSPTITST
jgi:hypothetical protein